MAELQIKSIEPIKRKTGWFELAVADRAPVLIDSENIYKHSLRPGQTLSEEKYKSVKYDADLSWLKFRGQEFLSRRMMSERDLRRKLLAERRSAIVTDAAMALLKEYAFCDDSRFAASFIRSQLSRGLKSRMYLKKKLWEKGVDSETAQKAIDQTLEGFDEKSAVIELARKKLQSLKQYPSDKARIRLANFLKGRGFSWELIKTAIDAVMKSNSEDY